LPPEVLQVLLRLFHHRGVEVAQVHGLELLADQVVLALGLQLVEVVVDDFEPVHLLFDVRRGQVLLGLAFQVVQFDVFI